MYPCTVHLGPFICILVMFSSILHRDDVCRTIAEEFVKLCMCAAMWRCWKLHHIPRFVRVLSWLCRSSLRIMCRRVHSKQWAVPADAAHRFHPSGSSAGWRNPGKSKPARNLGLGCSGLWIAHDASTAGGGILHGPLQSNSKDLHRNASSSHVPDVFKCPPVYYTPITGRRDVCSGCAQQALNAWSLDIG